MFTTNQYSETIDSLIVKLSGLSDITGPEVQKALEDICVLLRIGRIKAAFYETRWHEKMKFGDTVSLYDSGNADRSRVLTVEMQQNSGCMRTARYEFSRINGEGDWSEQEIEKINILQKLLFAFNGHAVLSQLAENLKYRDSEIGIYNLAYFMEKLGRLIGEGSIGRFGVCFFNMRRLSVVNTQNGRESGTAVMKVFISGLQAMLDGDECVCRIGGDNFITLFAKEKVSAVISYLSGVEITDPISGRTYHISSAQGYYMIEPKECAQPADVMDRAGIAADIARKCPDEPYVFFDEKVRENVTHAREIENMFHEALKNEEFLVYYQPKVELNNYTISGAEALCRWLHDGEILQPYMFIPVLEKSRLICDLDFYMLEHICRDIRRWLDEGRKVVKISVNLSRVHMGDEGLLEAVLDIIDSHSVPHEYIEIELTETTTDVDYTELKKLVNGFMEQGIHTSVDDFGIGYSSLNLIRELPWNVLKIDKSFLPDGDSDDSSARTMLKDVVGLANDLGIQCIVEGVETPSQVELLKENKCYMAQGFYFGEPLPVSEFEKRLDKSK